MNESVTITYLSASEFRTKVNGMRARKVNAVDINKLVDFAKYQGWI